MMSEGRSALPQKEFCLNNPSARRSESHIYSSLCQALSAGDNRPAEPGIEDWHVLVSLAKAEGVAPLLYWVYQPANWPAGMPVEARQELARLYYASAARNALLLKELEHILGVLAAASIPVLVLKGAALASTLYPSIGLRPMADLDLLIPQADIERAIQIAQEQLGYQEIRLDAVPRLKELADYHVHLQGGPGQSLALELHWNLVSSQSSWYAVPVEWFWQHTIPLPSNPDSRMLAPEAQLLYLSAHAMLQHGASQVLLLWLYDIHALIRQRGSAMDWDWLAEQAQVLRWSAVLLEALQQAQACFHTSLPIGLLDRLAEQSDRRVSRLVAFKTQFPAVRLLYNWYTLISLKWPARLRFVGALLLPSRAYIRWRYKPRPAWVWPVFYAYRWGVMIWESISTVGRGIWRFI